MGLKTIQNTTPQTEEEKAFEDQFFEGWPLDQLNAALKKGDQSPDSPLNTAEKFKKYFFSKHKNV